MKKSVLFGWLTALSSALTLAACGGDDTSSGAPGSDASTADSTASDGSFPDAAGNDATASDAGSDSAPVDAGHDAQAQRVLLSMNNATTSELLAMDLPTGTKNSLIYPGSFGTTFSRGADPYLLESNVDVVAKLDATQPWKVVSSWSVALTDQIEGGAAYADPFAIALTATKGYVVRYTRNQIAVIDTTQTADAGAPPKTIDLSEYLYDADADGTVEATFAFYVAKRHLVYVLLGNIDKTKVAGDGFTDLCTAARPELVAIDTLTDTLTVIGSGPHGSIQLTGYNPAFGTAGAASVYDPTTDRLLVLSSGCNAELADSGPGDVSRRLVEVIDFTANTPVADTLIDVSTSGFPSGFAYIGPKQAVLGLGSQLFQWDPTSTTLGAPIPNAPDTNAFAYAGNGTLVGVRTNYLADGGKTLDVVETTIADGGTTTIATNPFTDNTGFIGGVEVW